MLSGISSMATRDLLAELARDYLRLGGAEIKFLSIGGVDAAKRIASGEPFDIAVLAADAIEKLVTSGHVVAGSRTDIAVSHVAIAVRGGEPQPDIATEGALKDAVMKARSIGYSTGPSGTALLKLFETWGMAEPLKDRLIQAPPGMPVGKMLAEGKVEIGFQQYSELLNLGGIQVIGMMPPACAIVTTFSAGLCAASGLPAEVRQAMDFFSSPETAACKRRHGMEAP